MKLSPTTCFALLLLFVAMDGSDSTSSSTGLAFAASPSGAADPPSSMKNGSAVVGENGGAEELPRLPPVDPNSTEKIRTLKFGETLRLEDMGPIIINTDGTTRRIDNWKEMTKHEQEVTWRRIKKRNEERRNKLLDQMHEHNTKEDEL